LGMKQPVDREGQHARSEMAAGEQRALGRRADADAVEAGIAVPLGDERDRIENEPAMRVGDIERQAPIGKAVRRAVHPIALDRRRDNARRLARSRITNQPHPPSRSSTSRMSGPALGSIDLPPQTGISYSNINA